MRILDLNTTNIVSAESWIPIFYNDRTYKISATALTAGAITYTTSGDVEVTDSTKGIILRSPNGTRWRITIDNAGTLIRAQL